MGLSFFRIKYTDEELDCLRKYISGFDKRYLERFTTLLKSRLKRIDKKKLYGMLRYNVVKMKKEHLRIIEKYNIYREYEKDIENEEKTDKVVSDCNDDYFMNLVDKENYEDLFNNYDLDEIIRYSNDSDNPLGARRK